MTALPYIHYQWALWTMFGSLICLCLSWYRQPQWMAGIFTAPFHASDRSYGETAIDLPGMVLLGLYAIGTVSITLAMIHPELPYWWVLLATILFIALKVGLTALVNWTFRLDKVFGISYYQYAQIWVLFLIVLFPTTLLLIHHGLTRPVEIIGLVVLALMMIILNIKAYQVFFKNLLSVLYITIYIVSMELVPILLLLL